MNIPEVRSFPPGTPVYGEIASPFLSPNKRLLDTQYGIRKDGHNFKIGNFTVTVDNE